MRTEHLWKLTRVAGALALAVLLIAAPGDARGQSGGYLDHDSLGGAIQALVSGSNGRASVETIGASHDGRDVWLITVGNRDGAPLDERPALLVVGNLEGDHLIGSALALETVRYLLESDDAAVAEALSERTFYVVPRLNPDGAEAMFAAILGDRRVNARPHDDDNDGRTDEDPADDLNGDGLITLMRVPDPYGEYIPDPDDARLMKRADAAKGESGAWSVHHEGLDDDGDGFFNEDGPGGVDLNRNFQHAYPYWSADAGAHMVSEPESRALMDFVVAHRNIAAVLTFGLSDNLVNAPDGQGNLTGFATSDLASFADASNAGAFDVGVFEEPGRRGGFGGFGGFGGGGGPRLRGAQLGRNNDPSSGRRPATTVNRSDLEYFKAVSDAYREITGIESTGIAREPEGAFFQVGYYHLGLPSFSTPGWGPSSDEASEEAPEEDGEGGAGGADESEAGGAATMRMRAGGAGGGPPAAMRARMTAMRGQRPGGAGGPGAGGPGGPGGGAGDSGSGGADARLVDSLDDGAFVNWTEFEHPQLGTVEIGGFRPYATTNPPADAIGDLGSTHGEFAVRLASMMPRASIVSTEVTAHGGGVFTVTAEVVNEGYFPTAGAHAQSARAVHPVSVQIGVDPENVLTGADKTATMRSLDGSGGREKVTWVVRGSGGERVEIRLITQNGGIDSATVTLR